jgi:hypothetical protein
MPDGTHAGTDTVLDELEVLLTVEHALIVEYLTLQCAFGPGELSTTAFGLAAGQMFQVKNVIRALDGKRPFLNLGRATGITGTDGTAISLEPPGEPELLDLLDREESIARAVDAQYAALAPAVADVVEFSDEVRLAVDRGQAHHDPVTALRDQMAGRLLGDLLHATRRTPGSPAERVALGAIDAIYAGVLDLLRRQFFTLGGESEGDFRLAAIDAMNRLNTSCRALAGLGLLPSFTMPQT